MAGIFSIFSEKRRLKKQLREEAVAKAVSEYSYVDKNDINTLDGRRNFVQGNCEIINEAKRQNLEAKKEYEVVTAYLADMQRIDMIPAELRAKVNECAEKLKNLNKERISMQKTPYKITNAQRTAIEPFEDSILDEISRLEEEERYQQVIDSDMSYLEAEKEDIGDEINRLIDRTEVEKKLFMISELFCMIFLLVLLFAYRFLKKDVTVPGWVVLILAVFLGGYLILDRNKSIGQLKYEEKKQKRAIFLLNKVKIKCVNNTNIYDYTCEKFHVSSAAELHYNWQEYNRILDEEKRFKTASDLIELTSEELVGMLAGAGLTDPSIWASQPEAIVDQREMVEARHRLNVRRQKLRKQIDYNNTQQEMAIKAIKALVEKKPGCSNEVKEILANNDISGKFFS